MGDHPSHESSYSRYPNQHFFDVNVGGLFWDIERYNQISFAIGTLTTDGGKYYSVTMNYYSYIYNREKNYGVWMKGESQWSKLPLAKNSEDGNGRAAAEGIERNERVIEPGKVKIIETNIEGGSFGVGTGDGSTTIDPTSVEKAENPMKQDIKIPETMSMKDVKNRFHSREDK